MSPTVNHLSPYYENIRKGVGLAIDLSNYVDSDKLRSGAGAEYKQIVTRQVQNAITEVASAGGGTIFVSYGVYELDDDVTVPSTVDLVLSGGQSDIPTGKTFTVAGHLQIDAGMFTGSGTLALSSGATAQFPESRQVFESGLNISGLSDAVPFAVPEWWGVDGTDDHVEIQIALDQHPNVFLNRKTYSLGSLTIDLDTHVGQLLDGRGATLVSSFDGDILKVSATDVAIRNLTMTVTGTGKTSQRAIYVDTTATGVRIEDVTIDGAYRGIRCDGTSGTNTNLIVSRCTITNTRIHGVEFAYDVSYSIIENCYLENTNIEVVGASVYIAADATSHHNVAKGNRVYSSNDNGIRCVGPYCVITGNTVAGATTDGIRAAGDYVTTTGNTVSGCTESGIKAENYSHIVVASNTVIGNTQHGITVRYGTALPREVTVANNACYNNQYGILIYGVDGCNVIGNTVSGNRQTGIFISGGNAGYITDRVKVTGNTCRGNGTSGNYDDILIRDDSGYVGRAVFQGNQCDGRSLENVTITGITQANPGVVTYSGTQPAEGATVYIKAVNGMTEVNGQTYTATNVTSTTFQLYSGGSPVNTSGYGAYTSGGCFNEVIGNGGLDIFTNGELVECINNQSRYHKTSDISIVTDVYIEHDGDDAPTLGAANGSIWRVRNLTGAGSVLYVRENTAWVAK